MLLKQDFYAQEVWPGWLNDIRNSARRAILLHGTMGSELYDRQRKDTLWVDTGLWHEVDNLAFDRLSPEGSVDCQGQFVYARSTVNLPVLGEHYGDYLVSVGLGRFNYDWRDSLAIEAQRLRLFLLELRKDGKPLHFVTHSMGGCVLLRLLATTREFDDAIGHLVFIAPPFWGALKPLRVIEDGNGTPADWLIRNAVLRESAASLPGLFNLIPAPAEVWPTRLPGLATALQYPVRTGEDLYRRSSWTNLYRPELRDTLLRFARSHYELTRAKALDVAQRFSSRITVIVGLNGKTEHAAQRDASGDWTVHSLPRAPAGKLSNGDGTVLLQSSLLPGLPTSCYWAYVPPVREDSHGGLPNEPLVINAIRSVFANMPLDRSGLVPWDRFIGDIDFGPEAAGAPPPAPLQDLDYQERARMRTKVPVAEWGEQLNPGGEDDRLFHATRQSALKVLGGADLRTEAARLGVSYRFLLEHLQSLVAPALFG
ncbi:alpha/beta fold hydrolase [Aggregicoccus sp. 17bor-14]|uniref:alpha/beta fold hydrolase n=1 Tax=Myxococcaceae TaxID=31 RepID=UPI00129C5CD1|nr:MULTISPECIES: alpha/beta fold hydrolase [Myxococcaceae]MBF5046451.1 alpha/beta fold hydrolase [Simulacricoccus sp. 17bor-14]MRI92169.1 alpha/beta fold hydrolase [Aggregicoccus sp. 17bor-14]